MIPFRPFWAIIIVLLVMACSVETASVTTRTIYPSAPTGYDATSDTARTCLAAPTPRDRYGQPNALGPCVSVVFLDEETTRGRRIGFSDFANDEIVFVIWQGMDIVNVSQTSAPTSQATETVRLL